MTEGKLREATIYEIQYPVLPREDRQQIDEANYQEGELLRQYLEKHFAPNIIADVATEEEIVKLSETWCKQERRRLYNEFNGRLSYVIEQERTIEEWKEERKNDK